MREEEHAKKCVCANFMLLIKIRRRFDRAGTSSARIFVCIGTDRFVFSCLIVAK